MNYLAIYITLPTFQFWKVNYLVFNFIIPAESIELTILQHCQIDHPTTLLLQSFRRNKVAEQPYQLYHIDWKDNKIAFKNDKQKTEEKAIIKTKQIKCSVGNPWFRGLL